MDTNALVEDIIASVARTLKAIKAAEIHALQQAVLNSSRIFIAGKGRTGLQMKGFGMRLMHLGLRAHVVDEVTTPGIGEGDLLIIGSGSGRTGSLLRYADRCIEFGGTLAIITGNLDGPLAEKAEITVEIQASNEKAGKSINNNSVLVMGSLFEHTLGLLCDLIVLQLKAELGIDEAEMIRRHANLE
ncbi:MAG: 6-phospho-3-hexuloisomerase [Chloroflexota bacterium]